MALNEGSCLIEKNKDIYIHTSLDCIKKKIFYQIFECNEDNISENEYYTSINGNEIEKLEKNNSFITSHNEIEFYF